jgi:hypothetical protein
MVAEKHDITMSALWLMCTQSHLNVQIVASLEYDLTDIAIILLLMMAPVLESFNVTSCEMWLCHGDADNLAISHMLVTGTSQKCEIRH